MAQRGGGDRRQRASPRWRQAAVADPEARVSPPAQPLSRWRLGWGVGGLGWVVGRLAVWRPRWGGGAARGNTPGDGQPCRGCPRLHRLPQKVEGGTAVRLGWQGETVAQGLCVPYRPQRSHALRGDAAYHGPKDRSQ